MRRTATLDAVVEAFDEKISDFLQRNRPAIEKEYRAAAGREVSDDEIDGFLSGLADDIYSSIVPDESHLQRFADFYVGDDRLEKLVSEAVERGTGYQPAQVAAELKEIAELAVCSSSPVALMAARVMLKALVSRL